MMIRFVVYFIFIKEDSQLAQEVFSGNIDNLTIKLKEKIKKTTRI